MSLAEIQKKYENPDFSILNLKQCEKKIKNKYNISEENQLLIFKIDLKSIDDLKTYVYYEIYNPFTFEIINIEEICQDDLIEINSPVILDNNTLILSPKLASLGYNLFNGNDSFYNDICTPYTHLNGADMLLIDRKIYIYNVSGN